MWTKLKPYERLMVVWLVMIMTAWLYWTVALLVDLTTDMCR